MNVYDFDNTIYDGESTFDFFFYCVKKQKSVIKYLFPVVRTLLQYKMCMISIEALETRCEKYMVDFLSRIKNPKQLIVEFWDKNEHKIKSFYFEQKRDDDVIISASCDVLLKEICKRLDIKNLIASEIDFDKMKVKNLCYGENKVRIFNKLYPDAVIDEFYTDSKNDLPMAKIAKKAFFVKGRRITQWK